MPGTGRGNHDVAANVACMDTNELHGLVHTLRLKLVSHPHIVHFVEIQRLEIQRLEIQHKDVYPHLFTIAFSQADAEAKRDSASAFLDTYCSYLHHLSLWYQHTHLSAKNHRQNHQWWHSLNNTRPRCSYPPSSIILTPCPYAPIPQAAKQLQWKGLALQNVTDKIVAIEQSKADLEASQSHIIYHIIVINMAPRPGFEM